MMTPAKEGTLPMSRRPPMLTLRLTRPRMGAAGGPEAWLVREVQGRLYGVDVDGVYGCESARAVADWQWRAGAERALGAITPTELLVLLGYRPRPADWIARTESRLVRPGVFRAFGPIECEEPPRRAELRIITREQAGLRPPRGRSYVSHGPGIGEVDHWQGPGHAARDLAACLEQLRRFQSYHMDGHGWSDIGYNWAIPRGVPTGVVVELRGANVRGAHSGHNVANAQPGVLVMLGADDAGPSAEQLATLELMASVQDWGRRTGHQEWYPTACPGPDLMSFIRSHR